MCAYVLNKIGPWRAEAGCIAAQLEEVGERLTRAVGSSSATASELALHLLNAGGKRIRPSLVLLSVGACGGDLASTSVIDLAAGVELLHMASLVHDDVVDETRERRGVTTANGRWGNKMSVLGGDFLLAKAFSLLVGVSATDATAVLSAAAIRMTESEMLQAESEGDADAWISNYWKIIGGKTAAFMSACCECGAIVADALPEHRQALSDFGSKFGMAFQITDDLLDILGDPSETGKDIGADLMHGKFTLPVLLAIDDPDKGPELRSWLQREILTPQEAGEVALAVIGCGAAAKAREMAVSYAKEARACLESIPSSPYTLGLASLAASTADREA
jgi:geranylgeranyl pyrophosphate synthase